VYRTRQRQGQGDICDAGVRHDRLIGLVDSKRKSQNLELAIGGRGVVMGFNTAAKVGVDPNVDNNWKDGGDQARRQWRMMISSQLNNSSLLTC